MSNSYAQAWGADDLRTKLSQIGSNQFAEHGDWSRFVEEKTAEAEALQAVLQAQTHETGVEIGSGTGVHAAYFAQRSTFLTTLDVTDGFLDLFGAVTEGIPNLRRIRSDFFPMMGEFADGSIDYIYATSVFCHLHIYDVYLYFEEIARVLKPGGRFYVNYQNDFDTFFMTLFENYRRKTGFEPIHPGQMQFHSNAYFFNLAKKFGMTVAHERIEGTYSELMFRK